MTFGTDMDVKMQLNSEAYDREALILVAFNVFPCVINEAELLVTKTKFVLFHKYLPHLLWLTHTVFSLCSSAVSLCVPHFQLSEELKQHLNQTMTDNYAQPGREAITLAVDRLQQDVWTLFFTKASKALFGLCNIICCTFSLTSMVKHFCYMFVFHDSVCSYHI